MKKLKELRKRKIMLLALGIIAIIATICILTDPGKGVAMAIVAPIVVGSMTLEGKDAELFTALQDAIKKEFEKKDKDYISAEKFKENVTQIIKDSAIDLKDNEHFKQLEKLLNDQGLRITALNEKGNPGEQIKSLGQQFKDYMTANPAVIKSFMDGSVTEMKIQLKTAGNILDSTNVTGTAPAAFREPGLTDIGVERRFIMDVIGYGPTSNKTIEFVEKKSQDGTVVFVLDTEAFAQIDFDLDVNSSTAKDVGGIITVHENMLADIDFMAGEIDKELVYQIKKSADGEILSGAGTTFHLKGIDEYASAFSLTTIAQQTPNIGDCIAAAMTQIETVGFGEANFIAMHSVDYNNLIGTKDSNGRYVGHPFLSPDGQYFAGIPITRTTFVPAGYLLVGDKMKSNIKVLQDITIAVGYNLTGEFAKRLITVRGAMRLHHYIKDNDANCFVYDAIADIKAAITAV
jgi:HK97 family phage major capsid protein